VNLVDPDPAGSNVSGSGSDLDPAGCEAGSGKYWPDLHNHDIKHHSILSFHQMTHDITELYTTRKLCYRKDDRAMRPIWSLKIFGTP